MKGYIDVTQMCNIRSEFVGSAIKHVAYRETSRNLGKK